MGFAFPSLVYYIQSVLCYNLERCMCEAMHSPAHSCSWKQQQRPAEWSCRAAHWTIGEETTSRVRHVDSAPAAPADPRWLSYASVTSGEKMWDSRLSCNSTNKLKHSESCLLATVGNTLWVCRISRVNSGVRALRLGLRQARNLVVRSSYIMHPIWVHDSGMQVWCNVKYSLKVPQSILNMSVNYFRRLKKYITLDHNI